METSYQQALGGSSHLVTMVIVVVPRPGVVGPLPNGRTSWLINGGDPNYLRYLNQTWIPKLMVWKKGNSL